MSTLFSSYYCNFIRIVEFMKTHHYILRSSIKHWLFYVISNNFHVSFKKYIKNLKSHLNIILTVFVVFFSWLHMYIFLILTSTYFSTLTFIQLVCLNSNLTLLNLKRIQLQHQVHTHNFNRSSESITFRVSIHALKFTTLRGLQWTIKVFIWTLC